MALIFYGALAALALFLNAVRGAALVPLAGGDSLLTAFAVALAAAAATVAFSRHAVRHHGWAQHLEATFRRVLGPLARTEVLVLAFSSGIAEELFFRGAVQPALASFLGSPLLGLLLTTLAFAALHTAPGHGLLGWTVFAFVLGLVLGGLYMWTENVLPPIALHVTVNAVNLQRIARPVER